VDVADDLQVTGHVRPGQAEVAPAGGEVVECPRRPDLDPDRRVVRPDPASVEHHEAHLAGAAADHPLKRFRTSHCYSFG
jgi:hypothetical protein